MNIQTNNKEIINTDEEKREAARVRKVNQRQRLKDTYGNDEYNRQKAAKLAEYRKNRKWRLICDDYDALIYNFFIN
jgi:hypothetical protein